MSPVTTLASWLLLSAFQICLADTDVIVKTKQGSIRGLTKVNHFGLVDTFLGIRFASPPVGPLRFKRPVPREPWEGVFNATDYGPACIQRVAKVIVKLLPGLGDALDLQVPIDEDCLYLNVWVPNPRQEKAPVLVNIHGGGFITGAGSLLSLEGFTLAATERVIVVTMNYRLGSFGFTYLDDPEVDGNAGLLDQLMAMQWVKDNIGAFGGDPEKITLMGQSAGAISVGLHMISPLSKGLFKRCTMQSGAADGKRAILPKSYMTNVAMQMVDNAGCPKDSSNLTSIVECLRSLDAMDLLRSEPTIPTSVMSFSFFPVVDGYFLRKHPEEAYHDGDYGNEDVLSGFTTNEGTAFLMLYNPVIFSPLAKIPNPTVQEMRDAFSILLPYAQEDTQYQLAQNYLVNNSSKDYLNWCDDVTGDLLFKCSVVSTNKHLAITGNNVYSYYFTHRPRKIKVAEWLGVPHCLDVIYVFGHVFNPKVEDRENKFDQEDEILSRRMMRYYANFARTGNPNEAQNYGSFYWPPYTNSDHRQLVLAPKNRTHLINFKEHDCSFWDDLGDLFPHDKA